METKNFANNKNCASCQCDSGRRLTYGSIFLSVHFFFSLNAGKCEGFAWKDLSFGSDFLFPPPLLGRGLLATQ